MPNLTLKKDGKRDRWNGYDNTAHTEVVDEFKKMDDVKKEIRKEQIKAGFGNPIDDDGGDSSDSDEDKYVDKMDMPGRLFFLFLIASLSPRDVSNKSNQVIIFYRSRTVNCP